MKATDLMIDDWVQHTSGKYMQVTAIDAQRGFACGIPHGWSYNNEYVPIPLTAEILEKNGFEKCTIHEIEYIGWRLNEYFSIELSCIDTFVWNDDVSIHYVHTLQHVLRLCGIEKEIEL